ncbi:MAG TPA: ABC transporter substrate-binding protein [Planctomycetaceae bacterium]|nr:ABC transporter substrate-binding protein [Planctomycetaceae bacterium]
MSTSQQPRSLTGNLLRHLGPGAALIVAAAAVLLFSDPRWKHAQRSADAPKKVALVNYVSVPVLEDGEAGMIAGLKEGGFGDGENLALSHYNAEGDRSTAILIAKEVVGADFDAVLTLSTPVLQAVANANLDAQRTHVFTLSTDPFGAGVGISRENPALHPAYMTGEGSPQPVASLFQLARQANPHLNRVGVVWNPAESNSEASTLLAREVCKKLHIELIEVTIDSSSAVQDAARALVSRQVQAIWAGGDATVAGALDTLIGSAREGGIPVFTNMPSDVKAGALFSLGADYFEVGRAGGLLAARVLKGADPAKIPVENYAPEVLALNLVARDLFRSKWKFGADWTTRASVTVDQTGVHQQRQGAASATAKP